MVYMIKVRDSLSAIEYIEIAEGSGLKGPRAIQPDFKGREIPRPVVDAAEKIAEEHPNREIEIFEISKISAVSLSSHIVWGKE